MTARKQRYIKKALATALAAAGLGLAALPAHAILEWRVLSSGAAGGFLVCDNNLPCPSIAGFTTLVGGDTNPSPDVISVNVTLINGLLGKFTFQSAGADDNFLTATTISNIDSTFTVQAAAGTAQLLTVEASRDGWLIPLGNPRTLTNAPSSTMTQTHGTEVLTGFNDGGNLLFGQQFATPSSTFTAGIAPCGVVVNGLSSCADLKLVNGIVENNPYSLTNRVTVASPATDGVGQATAYQVTDASTKFATPTVPEPASLLLLGAGLAALGFARRRTKA